MRIETNLNIVLDNILLKLAPPKISELLNTCAQAVYASNMRRVFNDGHSVDGTPIGRYSRKPIYINPKNSPKAFTPAGKKSKGNTFANGKPRKTKYFAGGYAQFKGSIGRDPNKVNLQLTGGLKSTFQNLKMSSGIGNEIGFISLKKGMIAEKMEDHFHCTIFGVSQRDREVVNEIVTNYTENLNK